MSDSQPNDDELPLEIADDEAIVRAVLTPWHYQPKKRQLKWQVFKPAPGTSDLSVMRLLMGADFCKNKAVEVGAKNPNPKNRYTGLATLRADSIRAEGSSIEDSRVVYLGHADIDHGLVVPPNDNPVRDPEQQQRITDRCKALLRRTLYSEDPKPTQDGWQGPELARPSSS